MPSSGRNSCRILFLFLSFFFVSFSFLDIPPSCSPIRSIIPPSIHTIPHLHAFRIPHSASACTSLSIILSLSFPPFLIRLIVCVCPQKACELLTTSDPPLSESESELSERDACPLDVECALPRDMLVQTRREVPRTGTSDKGGGC